MDYYTASGDPSKGLRILVADGLGERAARLQISGKDYCLRVTDNYFMLKSALTCNTNWDLLMCSLYFPDKVAVVDELIEAVKSAYHAKRLRGVICTSVLAPEALKFIRSLKGAKIPAAWMPYDFGVPTKHKEVDVA